MTLSRKSGSPTAEQYEAAYHGTREEDGDGIYVCWDCATPEERADPVRDNAAADEVCGRCTDVGWEYEEATRDAA